MEQLLLRGIQFQLHVPQPHAALLNLAHRLHLPHPVLAAALCLLNDLWTFTDACLVVPEPYYDLAVAVLQAACGMWGHQVEVPGGGRGGGSSGAGAGATVEGGPEQLQLQWWQLVGVSGERMDALLPAVLDAWEACVRVCAASQPPPPQRRPEVVGEQAAAGKGCAEPADVG